MAFPTRALQVMRATNGEQAAVAPLAGTLIFNTDTGLFTGMNNALAFKAIPFFDGTGASGTWSISISGNAGTVTTNANLTGDITSVGNATTLATVNASPNTYGSATQVPVFVVNAKGLVTSVTNTTITGTSPGGAASGVLAGTYPAPSFAAGAIVNADINAAAGIVDTKLATISTAGKVSNSATTATSANTGSAIMARDSGGNFSASAAQLTTFTVTNGAFSAGIITTATTGSANTADLQLTRGDAANGFCRVRYSTGGSFKWSAGMRSGAETYQLYDEVNLVQTLVVTAGSGTTSTAAFAGSITTGVVIASTYGGTGNGFTKFSGPTTSEKTFTLPDASATILTSNTVVTAAQGGTGQDSSAWAQGDLVYISATGTWNHLAKNTSATRYLSNTGTTNNPAWAQIDLTNGVTGILPNANTTATSASTASAIVARDSSQNFSAGTITANLTGTASTATVANTISTATESSDTTCFPVFVTASGTQSLAAKTNTTLTYNSSTSALGAALFTSSVSSGSIGLNVTADLTNTTGLLVYAYAGAPAGNDSTRLFMKEDSSGNNGFSVGYNGGATNDVLNWTANTFNISRHNSNSTGVVSLTIARTGGMTVVEPTTFSDATASTSGTTGAVIITGGLGVGGDVVTSGNHIVNVAGKTLKIKQGSNACAGTGAVMVAGAVTVSTTAVATGDIVLLEKTATAGTPGAGPPVITISNGASFTITGLSTDLSTWSWVIIKAT